MVPTLLILKLVNRLDIFIIFFLPMLLPFSHAFMIFPIESDGRLPQLYPPPPSFSPLPLLPHPPPHFPPPDMREGNIWYYVNYQTEHCHRSNYGLALASAVYTVLLRVHRYSTNVQAYVLHMYTLLCICTVYNFYKLLNIYNITGRTCRHNCFIILLLPHEEEKIMILCLYCNSSHINRSK